MPSLNIARFPFPMRDWPRRLRLNVAATQLAPDLYAAHVAAHGGLDRPWLTLPVAIRQRFVEVAAEAINDVRLR